MVGITIEKAQKSEKRRIDEARVMKYAGRGRRAESTIMAG